MFLNFDLKKIDTSGLLYKDDGKSKKVSISKITNSYDEAFLEERDIIIICSQTNYHEEIVKKIKPYIVNTDVVYIQPGYASTAYFIKNNIILRFRLPKNRLS